MTIKRISQALLLITVLAGCGEPNGADGRPEVDKASYENNAAQSQVRATEPRGDAVGQADNDIVGDTAQNRYFPPTVTKPRVMLLGDSITGGSGCWKKYLKAKLVNSGITQFEFVGSRSDDCGGGVMHEGHSCATAEDMTHDTYANKCSGEESGLRPLLELNKPDMVMMTLGTNDAWGVPGVERILKSYTLLVKQMRAHNPNMVIAVAQIPKMKPDGNHAVYQQAADLVEAVPAWAQGLSSPDSLIIVADLWTHFSIDDTKDGVHPTDDVGHQKVAENWYRAVGDVLRAAQKP